jgi:CO dehydrogenase nickel-insertion accessory protein CooC1
MVKNSHSLEGKRIGVFGKGGSGKSTFVTLLATALHERDYEICVLDADSTNVGLAQALGANTPARTLVDYYGGMVFSGGRVTCPVDDPTPLENAEISLNELPSQYYARNEDGIVILNAGKIGEQGPGAGCDGPISKIARDLVISTANGKPITLIDFKAGFEDSARGVMTNLDWAVVAVDPTIASVTIAANMRDMVEQIKQNVLPATAHLESHELIALANRVFTEAKIEAVYIILNRVTSPEIESYLRERLTQVAIEPIGVIYEDPTIPSAWLRGKPINSTAALRDTRIIVDRLEALADHQENQDEK